MEILQYYDVIFATAIHPESVYNPRVIIYNENGQMIYPVTPEKDTYYAYLPYQSNQMQQVKNPLSGHTEYVVYGNLAYSGFTTAVVVDSAAYYAPIFEFFISMLVVLAAVVLVCCITAYLITQRLSAPIIQIYSYLHGLDFAKNRWHPIPVQNSGILEIDVLQESIHHFQQELHLSMESNILLQKQDMQSQMLALQAQMNPHFLYNSLATISAMAEEGMTDEIGEMCSNITTILRYISSNKQQLVPLEDELANTYRYMNCLKLRFGESLKYTIDLPDEMLSIPVPKLCVQLLVENAVKYTTPTHPPWEISVTGYRDDNLWIVTVADNGTGFSPTALHRLEEIMEEIHKSKLLPNLELEGMGLLNIYIRLYLLFGGGQIFSFGNRPEGGAQVTIGSGYRAEDRPLQPDAGGR